MKNSNSFTGYIPFSLYNKAIRGKKPTYQIPQEITYLAQEATSSKNDGYAAEAARKRLEAIKIYIEKVLTWKP